MKIGMGFPGLLTLLFVAFKILGNITWSWWWVFSPLWIPLAAVIVALSIVGLAKIRN